MTAVTPPLASLLADARLRELGGFTLTADDNLGDFLSLILVGPDEPSFWPHFIASQEYTDGSPDPLDRWSARILSQIAAQVGGRALFPFGGPPYHPFYTWALRTGRFWASPIGFLVQDTVGLFASFRGALLLREPVDLPATTPQPCLTCPGTPCKSACPVNAFADGYDVAACKTYLHTTDGRTCMTGGCLARRACPVGADLRLPAQSAFHMKAFR